jgi:hypothetical protein
VPLSTDASWLSRLISGAIDGGMLPWKTSAVYTRREGRAAIS